MYDAIIYVVTLKSYILTCLQGASLIAVADFLCNLKMLDVKVALHPLSCRTVEHCLII